MFCLMKFQITEAPNEWQDKEVDIDRAVNMALSDDVKAQLFSGEFSTARNFFDELEEKMLFIIT